MQAGLKFNSTPDTFTAKLYNTEVVKVEHIGLVTKISFDSGNWYTQSTAKAMNSGLKQAGIAGHVNRKQGSFIATIQGQEYKFDERLEITL